MYRFWLVNSMDHKYLICTILISGIILANTKENIQTKSPRKAFYFSLVPGLGQVYNGKWVKSLIIISLEYAAYEAWSRNKNIYNNYDLKNRELSKYRYLSKRNKYAWWIGIIYVYGMIDAIVDAHLDKFDQVMESPIENEEKEENINE
tara:strand:- start:836 stop:1279 length:444 start_codon:yes stop_codon:yes gene_type:complete